MAKENTRTAKESNEAGKIVNVKNKGKKVIRRYIKNSKTGELIKTEIIKIDSNGERTTTSFPAGSVIPELDIIQNAGRRVSKDSNASADYKDNNSTVLDRGDIGPSVPANLPGLDDLLAKEAELDRKRLEKELNKEKESKKSVAKGIGESLESALITLAKKKRQKDPKARRRGLMASTKRHDYSDENNDNNMDADNFNDDTDYRNMRNIEEVEEDTERKEKHRRRHEKKKDRSTRKAKKERKESEKEYLDEEEEEETELHPLEEAELAKKLQATNLAHQEVEKMEEVVPSPKQESPLSDSKTKLSNAEDSNEDNDKKKSKKKKHKNKKKKKKTKKAKKKEDSAMEDVSDEGRFSSEEKKKEDKFNETENFSPKKLSRSNSLSSLSISSISSAFSESFDFAEVVPFAGAGNDFDNALGEYQRMRGIRGGYRGGRGGFDPFFRGRPPFRGGRGNWRGRGNFRGRGRGFDQFQGFDPYGMPMGMMGGPGRGAPGWRGGMWGPGWGRGFNNYEEPGIGIYVEDDSDGSKRRKSYSSRSYSSSSYSSRSRSRSRRRRRKRRYRSSSRSSSRSYSSRSYSRSSRSYSRSSRSYSRSTSRSYSSSRSRSRSRSRSPEDRSMRDVYAVGERSESNNQNEDVPWWAEFDKTYEIEKQKQKAHAASKVEDRKTDKETALENNVSEEPVNVFGLTMEEIYTVRCVIGLVDKVSEQQDVVVEEVRGCIHDMVTQVVSQSNIPKEVNEVEKCMNDMLDQICQDEPVVKENEAHLENFPYWNEKELAENKILDCYVKACKMRLDVEKGQKREDEIEKEDRKSDEEKNDDYKSERKGRSGRRRKRGRRRRRYSRSYSRSTSYSSSSSPRRQPLVSLTSEQEQSLHQAQQMLFLQQKQLQAAGILPAHLAIPAVAGIPIPVTSTNTVVPEPEILSNRWDKDMDLLLKTKSKDDITRKLMQRMKEKKQHGDESPTFMSRKLTDGVSSEKVFSGGANLKSRKIAISSIEGGKLFKDGVSDTSEFVDGKNYSKSDLDSVTAQYIDGVKESEKSKSQDVKLQAWSEEQRILKEEVKRKMRENIEKAERAKKEHIKEQMLEQEKQKEIMRIREEVRAQIKKEIQEEIEKERKQVLDDPEMKSQLLELEALKKSKVAKVDGNTTIVDDKSMDSFALEQDKHKQEMNLWLEKHGRTAADMSVSEMRKMQMHYMEQLQHWGQQQQKAYMQWYWANQRHYQQHRNAYQPNTYYNQQRHPQSQRTTGDNQLMQHFRPETKQNVDQIPRTNVDPTQNVTSHPDNPHLSQPHTNSIEPGLKHPNLISQSHSMMGRSLGGQPRFSSQHHHIYQDQLQHRGPIDPLYSRQHQQRPIMHHQQQVDYQHKIPDGRTNIRGPNQHPQQRMMSAHSMEDNMPQSIANHPGQPMYRGPPNPDVSRHPVRPPGHPALGYPTDHRHGQVPHLQPPSQFHPPGYQESVRPQKIQTVTTPPPGVDVQSQPLPPGDESAIMRPPGLRQIAPPGVDDLAPPGVETTLLVLPGQHDVESKLSKKKKKKHRKKKRESSSEGEEDEEESKRKEIMEQLEALKTKPEEDVEDGEVKTDEEAKSQVDVKKKKKHKHKKKKKRKKRESSSEEEPDTTHQSIPVVTDSIPIHPPQQQHAPLFFQEQPPGRNISVIHPQDPIFNPNVQDPNLRMQAGLPPSDQFQRKPFPEHDAHLKPNFGAGEPHVNPHPQPPGHPRFNPYPGPSGDHPQNFPVRQDHLLHQPFSPRNLPEDPVELEAWARKMENRFHDDPLFAELAMEKRLGEMPGQTFPSLDIPFRDNLGSDQREFQRRGPPVPRMRHPDERKAYGSGRGRRKRESSGRGRKRRRMQRNYHDWDQPPNDSMVYYYSDSDSTGWGSDQGFDDMLAKKQRECGGPQSMHAVNVRKSSPAAPRPDNYHLNMGEPQGIPVIGGSQPQPIPSLANRVGPPLDRGPIGRRPFDSPTQQALFHEDDLTMMQGFSQGGQNYDPASRMMHQAPPGHPGGQFRHDPHDPIHRRSYGM